MKYIWVVLLLLVACTQQAACPESYIRSGDACCLDANADGACDPNAPRVEVTQAAEPSFIDQYDTNLNNVYFVKSECVYEYEYPDFFVTSWTQPQWGLGIDLKMKKERVITDENETGGSVKEVWIMKQRTNTTKVYGTAFLMDGKVVTASHVIECPSENDEIVGRFDLIDLSGVDVNKIGEDIYHRQENFTELREAKQNIMWRVNLSVADHFVAKAKFKLVDRKIQLYSNAKKDPIPVYATLVTNGSVWPGNDFAVLDIHGTGGFARGSTPKLGDVLYSISYPGIIKFEKPEKHGGWEANAPTLVAGHMIGSMQSDDNVSYYLTDAAVASGSSGGPVLDARGNVVGIVTAGMWSGDVNAFLPITEVPQ